MSRSTRSILSFASSSGFTVVTMLVSLVSTPLLLRWLGQERLGAYRASMDWAQYLGLLELGLTGALLPMFVKSIGRKESHQTRAVLGVGMRAFRQIVLLTLLCGAVLVWIIPWVVRCSPQLRGDLRAGMVFAVLAAIFTFFSPLRALLEAAQRGYLISLALTGQSLLITGVSLVLAWHGWGITGQWIAIFLGACFYNGLLIWHSHRQLPEAPAIILGIQSNIMPPVDMVEPGFAPADVGTAEMKSGGVLSYESVTPTDADHQRTLWKLNRPSLALNVAGRVGFLTDSVLIAAFLHPAAVVPFQLTQRLAQVVQTQLSGVGNATWAALAELHETHQHELFGRRLVQLTRLILVLGFAGMLPIIALNRAFVTRWVGDAQFGGLLLTTLAAVNGILLAVFSLWSWVFSGTGRAGMLVPQVLTGAVVNISMSFLGVKYIGPTGPLWGTFIAFVGVYAWWIPMLLRDNFGVAPARLARASFRPLAVAVPFGIAVTWAAYVWPPHSWPLILLAMASVGSGYLLLASMLAMDANERTMLVEQFSRRLPMFRRNSKSAE